MGRAEAPIERYLIDSVTELGGFTRKVVYQGRAGSPDRWCFLPGGKLLLVECKSSTGRLSAQQRHEIDVLQKIGQTVHVVSSVEEVDKVLQCFRKSAHSPP